jgi:hypothetical protein
VLPLRRLTEHHLNDPDVDPVDLLEERRPRRPPIHGRSQCFERSMERRELHLLGVHCFRRGGDLNQDDEDSAASGICFSRPAGSGGHDDSADSTPRDSALNWRTLEILIASSGKSSRPSTLCHPSATMLIAG